MFLISRCNVLFACTYIFHYFCNNPHNSPKINGNVCNVNLRNAPSVMCFRGHFAWPPRGRYTHVSFVLQESISRERFLRRLPSRLSSALALLNFRFFKACHPRAAYSGGYRRKRYSPFTIKRATRTETCARSLFTPLTLAATLC